MFKFGIRAPTVFLTFSYSLPVISYEEALLNNASNNYSPLQQQQLQQQQQQQLQQQHVQTSQNQLNITTRITQSPMVNSQQMLSSPGQQQQQQIVQSHFNPSQMASSPLVISPGQNLQVMLLSYYSIRIDSKLVGMDSS